MQINLRYLSVAVEPMTSDIVLIYDWCCAVSLMGIDWESCFEYLFFYIIYSPFATSFLPLPFPPSGYPIPFQQWNFIFYFFNAYCITLTYCIPIKKWMQYWQ